MTGLSDGEQIIRPLGDDVRSVQIVALAGGGYAVAYQGTEAAGGGVFVRVFDADGGLTAGPIDAAPGLGNPQTPVLAALPDGGFGLAYQFLTGPGSSDVNAVAFDADGSVRGGPVPIGTNGVVFDIPRAADRVGEGFVVLMQGAGPTISLFAELDENGAPQTIVPSFIGNPNVDATTPNDVAEGRDGLYGLLYADFENGDRQLRLLIREFGVGTVTDVAVAGETGGRAAGLGDGFVVAGGGGEFIFIDAAGRETGRAPIDASGGAVVDLVALSDGRAVVLYADGDDDFVQVLGADGAALTGAMAIPGLAGGGPASRIIASETSNGDLLFTRDRFGDGDEIAQILIDPAALIEAGGVDPVDPSKGTSGPDAFVGGPGADAFNGLGGDDAATGRGGADTLAGGRGRDELSGGAGRDDLFGGGGADDLFGGRGADDLSGGGGRDTLEGGAGRDRIRGDGGNDLIIGGKGDDVMTGGAGRDVFRLGRGEGSRDVITDFGRRDKIEIAAGATAFSDLRIRDRGDDVHVVYKGGRAILEDVDAQEIKANDFIF